MRSSDANAPAYRAIDILQEKWTLHIVRALLDAPRGFNELGRAVGGCNPTTLTQRLARLEALGLIAKTVQTNGALRCSYALTPAGEALEPVVEAIDDWACRHLRDVRHA